MDKCGEESDNFVFGELGRKFHLAINDNNGEYSANYILRTAFNAGYEQGFIQGVKQASESLANCHQSEIDALEAQVEELKADADRWRYFRETASEEMCYALCSNSNPENNELDKAIDQAIQQQKGE